MSSLANHDARACLSERSSFWSEKSGGIALMFALLAPVLIGCLGLAIDFGYASHVRASLQNAADAAALAGVRELSLSDAKRDNIPEVVNSVVEAFVRDNSISDRVAPKAEAEVLSNPLRVKVQVTTPYTSLFGSHFGMQMPALSVSAVARVAGQPNICALALEPRELGAISLTNNARMTGNNCAVFSNSNSSAGLSVGGGATLKASTVCSAGGVLGGGDISPQPFLDCPQFDDPLAGRPEPKSGGCDHIATIILNQDRVLRPGVYCLGLTITGFSRVTFMPGVYVIKNGPFLVALDSQIKGEGVGFFLQGLSFFVFDPLTKIELAAPKDGPMAGMLFFGSRSQSKLLINTILSSSAQVMLGTIYLPNTSLIIDSLAQVGGQSAYTAIVVRRLVLLDGPHLVLNTDYSKSDVPVPEGIKGAGQPAQLIK